MTKLRFTDADKWRDPWFQELPLVLKALWQYLTDNCDNAGVWVVNRREAEFHLGQPIDWDMAAKALSGRVQPLSPTKWHLAKFVEFQHPGGLSEKSAPHRQVMRLLEHHGLPFLVKKSKGKGAPESESSLHSRLQGSAKDKDTDTDKDKDKEEDKDSNASAESEELFAQAKSIMAADAAPKPPLPVPARSFRDFRAVHGRLFIGRDERDDWEALFKAYEWDPMHDMHETLTEDRIYLNAATQWLAKNYRLTE